MLLISVGWTPACVLAMPRARRRWRGLVVPSALLPSSSAEGKNGTESVTSRKSRVCFAATGG